MISPLKTTSQRKVLKTNNEKSVILNEGLAKTDDVWVPHRRQNSDLVHRVLSVVQSHPTRQKSPPHTTLCLHTSHSAFCSACPQSSSHRSCPCPSWSHATQSRTSLSQETHPCGTRAPSPLPAASLLHTRSAAKVKMRSSTPSLLPSFPSLPLRTAEHFHTPPSFTQP